MILSPSARRFALAVHLTCSVGWIGAVVAYLALDITVATSRDAEAVRAAWIAMALIVWWAIVPLASASLVTGLVMALGTRWGLFRHWWVLISFVLTVLAAAVLLAEAGVISRSAAAAAASTSSAEVQALPPTLVHSLGGLGVLLVIQVLNVYKPPGVTPYGWRKQQEERTRLRASADPRSASPDAAGEP